MSNWWDAAASAYETARQTEYQGHAEHLKDLVFSVLGLTVKPKCRWIVLEYTDRPLFVTYFGHELVFWYLDNPLTGLWYESRSCYDLIDVGRELSRIDAWEETALSNAHLEELLYAYPGALDTREGYEFVSTSIDGR
jgi:hypothetical protein